MNAPHPPGRLASAMAAAQPRPLVPAEPPAAVASVVSLRDYQHDFVHKVRVEYRNGVKAVLLVAATGAGKTVVFSYIAKAAAAKGSRVLILAHRDQLIKQASRKLSDNGVQHGIIMAGFTPNARRLVQVASVQTLVRRIDKMKAAGVGFDLIVIDECLRGDSLIETDVGVIAIKDAQLKGASMVRSFNGSNDVFMPIEAFAEKGLRPTLRVTYPGGEIVCTGNHLFYTDSGWKRADQLTRSDQLFAPADAGASHQSTAGGIEVNGFRVTGFGSNPKSTGTPDSWMFWKVVQCARAAAAGWSNLSTGLLTICGVKERQQGGTANLFSDTKAEARSSLRPSVKSRSRLFLGHCLATQVYCSPMENQSTQGSLGTTGQSKLHGLNTRQGFCLGLRSIFQSSKTKATDWFQYAAYLLATQSFFGFTGCASLAEKSASPGNGWMHLGQSGLRGGIATTATLIQNLKSLFSIPKGLTPNLRRPFGLGWMSDSLALCTKLAAETTALFDFTSRQRSVYSTRSDATCQTSFHTRWVPVLSVSADLESRVYDIQVAGTHCFYANGVLVHNCHLSAAKSYMDILAAWPDARVLGVTGSPVRLDGKGLGRHAGGCFDTMVQGISIKELIAQGYLVKPTVYASKQQIDLSGVKKIGGEYDADAMAEVMDKPVITGSAIAEYRKICPGVPAVAWCTNVAHARHVAEEFNAAGIPAMALSGENTSEERDRALAMLSDGRLKLITFAMLLVEGVDCPAIGAVILLRLTMSLSSYLQTIGRGLRPIFAPGMPLDTTEQRMAAIDAGPKGRRCFVIDHCGLWQKHGFADAERDWDLDGVKKKKGKKKDDEPKIDLTQCPSCFVVFDPKQRPAGQEHVCPECGHAIPGKVRKGPEHVDGELAEITPEMEAALKNQKRVEVAGAKTLADLEKIAAQRGYSKGWAIHLWNARQRKNSGKSRAF